MTDGERLAILEVQMNNIEKKVDAGFLESEKRNEELKKMLTDFIEKSENRFASKWVEDALKWVLYLGAGIIISALIYLVIDKQ